MSKIIGVVSLPFKVTSTSKTPPLRLISTALLSTDFSRLTSCFTLSSNPREGPSLSGDFDLDFRASRADLDRVVLGQLGVLAKGRVDELAEVEDRLDVASSTVAPLRCRCLASAVGRRRDLEQIELIVDFVQSRHDLVVRHHILPVDGSELLAQENPFLEKSGYQSSPLIDRLFEFVPLPAARCSIA